MENLKPFTKDNQPSPVAKKEGWERRRQALRFLDKLVEYQDMALEDLQKIDIKKLPLKDRMVLEYALKIIEDDRYLIDWMDRHISKANEIVLNQKSLYSHQMVFNQGL